MTTADTANPDMLVIAREAREMSQAALAEAVGIKQPLLSMYENGLRPVAAEHLTKLAEVTRFPESFFFSTDKQYGFASPCPAFYRKRAATTAREMKRLQAWANVFRIQIDRLLRSVELSPEVLPHFDLTDDDMSPDRAAALTRIALQLPLGPVRNLVRAVEAAGVVVVKFHFGTTRIDAVSHWPRGYRPMILLNAAMPQDRSRLSLAHELGHLTMHHPTPTGDSEGEANRFAAELLMPATVIRADLRHLTVARLLHLKECWGVSMAALIYRAHELGTISDSVYKRLMVEMSRRGFRRNEPGEVCSEEPEVLRALAKTHLDVQGLTLIELSRMLAMHPNEVRELYVDAPRRLRIAW